MTTIEFANNWNKVCNGVYTNGAYRISKALNGKKWNVGVGAEYNVPYMLEKSYPSLKQAQGAINSFAKSKNYELPSKEDF